MSQFHIVHIIPDPRLHILNGYNDVIKTLIWGLRCHGHEVSYGVNQPRLDARNIVLGANMTADAFTNQLPDDTIIYNLEQVSGLLGIPAMQERLAELTRRFVIWDYDVGNIANWRTINGSARVTYIPIGYAPILSTIPKPETQDIDILIYGGPSERRLKIFTDLCLSGAASLFCFGLYEAARDELIARSKLVLNISHASAYVFSVVRVSYLLANRKAVIADARQDLSIESDIAAAVQFAEVERFVDVCHHFLRDDDARRQLEEDGFTAFEKRDIREILQTALTA